MLRKSIFIVLGLLSMLISGCTSWPVYKLEPLGDKDYYMGREIAAKEDDSTRVSVEVDNYHYGRVVFFAQVENKSNGKIFIDPKDFYVDVISDDSETVDTFYPRVYAADPEKEIKKAGEDMEGRKSTHSFLTGANAVLAFISVASDLSNKNDEHKADHVGDDINVWANNQTDENINYGNSINDLNSKKEYWKNQALRKTDLYPGEKIGGIVAVIANPDADYLRLTIPFDNYVYSFTFKKIKVE